LTLSDSHGIELRVLRRAMLFCLVAGCVKTAPTVPPPAPRPIAISRSSADIRRVCMQMGLGVPGTGGGSIVFANTANNHVDTLFGTQASAPNPDALCTVPPEPMRVCVGGTADVPVRSSLADSGEIVGKLARGAPVVFYEYVNGGGTTKALVDVGGMARFIPGDDVCHVEGVPDVSRATQALSMNVSIRANPKAYRPRSLDAIRRVVIHNTETTLEEALEIFNRPNANTSAHVVIDRDGTIFRMVEDHYAAFHAGSSKDKLGGHNSTSLGIEVVAHDGAPGFTDAQRAAVIKLVDFWMDEYKLTIAPEIIHNHSNAPGYADLEYGRAALTIHRLTKADRGTDCPRLLFANSPEGDEQFFRWREATFGEKAVFRIQPLRPVDKLEREARTAQPPQESADLKAPDLVDLVALDPSIKLDVRYATTNNFLGTKIYREGRAFLQRPAAEALVRTNKALASSGYGLLVHDAYRPWYVTKIFWDATPEDKHDFVADPAKGSRHNRGCAVDLTLYDRKTGQPVTMPSVYDEMSERAFADYAGGTPEERRLRQVLRAAMEAEGFTVYPKEWWHFDHRDWKLYRIGNQTFDQIGPSAPAAAP
jgi:D-alanyl-D-alanine dipeptidase